MVKYFGRYICKQSIRNKPIKFAYKVCSQNINLGYLIALESFQGKTHKADDSLETKFGKCPTTVLQLIETYRVDKIVYPYCFFTDNIFIIILLQTVI